MSSPCKVLVATHREQHKESDRSENRTMPAKVLLLAGGQSLRMGSPKHLLPSRSGPALYEHLLQQTRQALKSLSDRDIYISLRSETQVEELKQAYLLRHQCHLPYNTLVDLRLGSSEDHTDIGPAAGLLTAYEKSQLGDWLVLACDYPLLNREAVDQLLVEYGHSKTKGLQNFVTCFVNSKGFYEPLLGVWSPQALQRLRQNVHNGRLGPSRTISDLVRESKAKLVKPLDERWILGANTPEEWERCMHSQE